MSTYDHISDYLLSNQDFERDNIRDTFEPCEVIYYHEAEGIISEHERAHGDEADELCGGKEYKAGDWLQARQDYANALNYLAQQSELESDMDALEAELEEFQDACTDAGIDEPSPQFSNDCPHGWAAHNRETLDGCMIWDTKAGHYNPELIEGECVAVSKKLSCGVYVTATVNVTETA